MIHASLSIAEENSIHVEPESASLPSGWPPGSDSPVTIDVDGNVVSRFGDSIWQLWPIAKKALTLNFGDGRLRRGGRHIDPANAKFLRLVMWWLMKGPQPVSKATTLKSEFKYLRSVFLHCSQNDIPADQLSRFPEAINSLASAIPTSRAAECIGVLHRLWEDRGALGFVILDPAGLKQLSSQIADHEKSQTPYIPPRIWTYQLNRLREFIQDFWDHRQEIADCYNQCIEAYDAGTRHTKTHRPFSHVAALRAYRGRFAELATSCGIDTILEKWLLPPNTRLGDSATGIRLFTRYLSMLGFVGTAYLINFGLMRIEEAWDLRCNCLEIEHDATFGDIYLLHASTTKTIEDDDARWIAAPSCRLAIEAMAFAARMRVPAAKLDSRTHVSQENQGNPYLAQRSLEPWCNSRGRDRPADVRPTPQPYQGLITMYPNLFDPEQLRITAEDLGVARRITPTLDPKRFAVGKVWPLAWHQLRRTGAVNMAASGRVSDVSLQYQLKHASRAMSLYYAHGYSRVKLDPRTRNEYVKTMYEFLSKQLAESASDRWVSPHGEKRKTQILQMVTVREKKQLARAAKAGNISFRETVLGACTRSGSCPYGGIDNLVRCGGADGHTACADALYDRTKLPALKELHETILAQQASAPAESPRRESLASQVRALENAINALEQ